MSTTNPPNLNPPTSGLNTRVKKPYRPSITDFMNKTGADFRTASDMVHGVVGSNQDTRDWAAIMASDDPLAASRKATYDMYGGVSIQNVDYGNEIIPKLVGGNKMMLTMPGKRNANFGLPGLWYDNLTTKSTPDQIAAAYDSFLNSPASVQGLNPATGQKTTPLDSAQNQRRAASILEGRGISRPVIDQAYQKYLNPSPLYESLTSTSTPEQIAAAYGQFTAGAGGDTQLTQNAALDFLGKRGISAPVISQGYEQFLNPKPLYEGLTQNSTPQQISAAYGQFVNGAGGDTAANQNQAASYLKTLGISEPQITDAYQTFLGKPPASPLNNTAVTVPVGSLIRGNSPTTGALSQTTPGMLDSVRRRMRP
jgi:hypothetical protein